MDLSSLNSLDFGSIGLKTKGDVLQDNKTQKTYMKVAVFFSIVCCILIFLIIGYVNFYAKQNKKFPYGYKRKYNSYHKN